MANKVVVFGSSKTPPGSTEYQLAREVGRNVGQRGLVLVSGGYAGTMGAASEGAREAGGDVVGITTAIFGDREPNTHLTECIEEPDYPSRMARMLREGDAFVALPGGLGTLSELVTAWCLASIGQLRGPLWAFAEPWRAVADQMVQLREVNHTAGPLLRWVDDAAGLGSQLDRWLSDRG